MLRKELYALLPSELLQGAYRSQNELAWPRDQALRIMDWLNANGYVVTNIQTWLPTLPGPSPLIDDWDSARAYPSPPYPMSAREFVAVFAETPTFVATCQIANKEKLAPVFNITAEKDQRQR